MPCKAQPKGKAAKTASADAVLTELQHASTSVNPLLKAHPQPQPISAAAATMTPQVTEVSTKSEGNTDFMSTSPVPPLIVEFTHVRQLSVLMHLITSRTKNLQRQYQLHRLGSRKRRRMWQCREMSKILPYMKNECKRWDLKPPHSLHLLPKRLSRQIFQILI